MYGPRPQSAYLRYTLRSHGVYITYTLSFSLDLWAWWATNILFSCIHIAMAEAEKITSEMKEALQLDQQETVASCKSKVSQVMCIQEITGNIRLQIQKVSMDIAKVQMKQSEAKEGLQRQGKQLHSHDSALKQHNLKFKLAETHLESLQQQQHNSAARLNYSTETVKVLLSKQEPAQKKLDETECTISALTAEKSQIAKELDKTSQLIQELSVIETETAGNMSSLRNQVGQVKSDVEKIQDAALLRHMSSEFHFCILGEIVYKFYYTYHEYFPDKLLYPASKIGSQFASLLTRFFKTPNCCLPCSKNQCTAQK